MAPVDDLEAVREEVSRQVPDPFSAIGSHRRVVGVGDVMGNGQPPQGWGKFLRTAQDSGVADVHPVWHLNQLSCLGVAFPVLLDVIDSACFELFPTFAPNVDHSTIHTDPLAAYLCMPPRG